MAEILWSTGIDDPTLLGRVFIGGGSLLTMVITSGVALNSTSVPALMRARRWMPSGTRIRFFPLTVDCHCF